MTHEEAVTTHVAQVVRSYRDLPLILYHFQVKERDEPRPARGRAAHARVHHEGLLQLRPRRRGPASSATSCTSAPTTGSWSAPACAGTASRRDVGMMGGLGAHEYMAPCAAGENEVALAPGYAANVEVASAEPAARRAAGAVTRAPQAVPTPGLTTRRRGRRAASGCREGALLKAYPGRRSELRARTAPAAWCSCSCAAITASTRSSSQLRSARLRGRPIREEIERGSGRPASSGRSASRTGVEILLDAAAGAGEGAYVTGANARRRAPARRACRDATSPSARSTCARSARATRWAASRSRSSRRSRSATSSSSARATPSRSARRYLDESGAEQPIWMGSYGIGPARIVAAAVEQFADEHGISWPRALAPFAVHLVSLGKPGTPEREAADERLRDAARRAAWRSSTTTATSGRARSSPTPSCSAARCG